MSKRPFSNRVIQSTALALFALSGVAGLIYQSIWSQYLGLYLGHAAYAQCLVLAIFMGGMAGGSWWVSRSGQGWQDLLRIYAYVELMIGLMAFAFNHEYLLVTALAYDHVFPVLHVAWLVSAFKWASGALLILPQSILLGMTFPLMSGAMMRGQPAGEGRVLSGLYFTNSMGAAFGALGSTFLLLPAFGLPGTIQVGAMFNLAIAIIAWLLSAGREPSAPAAAAPSSTPRDQAGLRLMVTAAFITGATSFVYEIGWVRMLNLALGTTLHSFELMLTAFIAGLAFGGLWIRKRIDAYREPVAVGGYVQVLMGIAALASLFFYTRSFGWVEWFIHALAQNPGGYALYNVVTAAIAILIMMPAAFFAGMTLPLFTVVMLRRGGGEASIGRIYAADTLGAIVGVFAAVYLLVPYLGLKLAIALAASGDIALGLVLLRSTGSVPVRRYLLTLAVAGATIVLAVGLVRFDLGTLSAGVYRTGRAGIDRDNQRVIYYRDGKTSTISVLEYREGARLIATNGKPDASIEMNPDRPPSGDEITMVMAGILSVAYSRDPQDIANIGFGSGLTTETLLSDPRVRDVDSIEIEPAMYEGAKAFLPMVERAYFDPRSHIHFEDAKTYFAAHQKRYDVIVSEPSNPWVTGVATLFSREFYGLVPRYLKPGGVFVQWMQLYEIDDHLVATVINSLNTSFKDYRVYLTDDQDMVIVASPDGPLPEMRPDFLAAPESRALMARVGLNGMADLRFHQLGDKSSLSSLAAVLSDRTNSDFYPVLSLEAPQTRFEHKAAFTFAGLPNADLPYLEWLDKTGPFAPGEVTIDQVFRRSLLYGDAVRLASALAGHGDPGGLPVVDQDLALAKGLGRCDGGLDASADTDLLLRLAGKTVPYLPAADLEGVWIHPAWWHCATPPAQLRDTLALLDAFSRRDASAAGKQAQAMLKAYPGLSHFAADYLLRVAMLSAIRQGEFGQVHALDQQLGMGIVPNDTTLMQRAYMLAYADLASAGGDSAAQPKPGPAPGH